MWSIYHKVADWHLQKMAPFRVLALVCVVGILKWQYQIHRVEVGSTLLNKCIASASTVMTTLYVNSAST